MESKSKPKRRCSKSQMKKSLVSKTTSAVQTSAPAEEEAPLSLEEEAERRALVGYELPEDRCAVNNALPDYLQPGLDIVFIGINPGLVAGKVGRYYPGAGNHFWKCVYHSGVISEQLSCKDDFTLPSRFAIGFTEIVRRTTRVASELKKREIEEGARDLTARLQTHQPRIAAFNGKEIYRIYSGKKNFSFGLQPELIDGTQTRLFVLPSSSARCTQLPRYTDKLPYYVGLRKLRDHFKGLGAEPTSVEVVFSSDLGSGRPAKLAAMSPMKTEEGVSSESLDSGPFDAIKSEALDSLLNTASAQGTPPHSDHDIKDPQGLVQSSSGSVFSGADALFSTGGNPIFHGSHNPLLSSTNTPSPTDALANAIPAPSHFAAPSTSASTPPFAASPAAAAPVDPAVVQAHIMESVMAVVERCKAGTLVIPDHYIRPSDIPVAKHSRAPPAPAPHKSHHAQPPQHHRNPNQHQPLPAHHQVKARQPQQPAAVNRGGGQPQQRATPGGQAAVLETYLSAPYLAAGNTQQMYATAPAAMQQVLQQAVQQGQGYAQGNAAGANQGGFPAEFYNAYIRVGQQQQQQQGGATQQAQQQPQQPQQQQQQQQQPAHQQQFQGQQQPANLYSGAVNPYTFMYGSAGGANGSGNANPNSGAGGNSQQNY